jgi:aryl-alcohol dehydrogenase-like predicted oxidoreductase
MMDTVAFQGVARPVSRLGFGCGGLTGGAGLKQSRALIEAALSAGITHFDVAPSYGLGMAEQVLGSLLVDAPATTVTTKAGVPVPRHGWAKSAARSLLKPVLANVPALKRRLAAMAQAGGDGPAPMGPSEVEASVGLSLVALRREALDIFLLHEPSAVVDPALVELVERLRGSGKVGAWGAGTGGTRERLPDVGTVAQFAWTPETASGFGRPAIRHGLLRSWLPRLKAMLAAEPTLAALSAPLGFDLGDAGALPGLLLTVALAKDPQGVVLLATNDPNRLSRTVTSVAWPAARGESGAFNAAADDLIRRLNT